MVSQQRFLPFGGTRTWAGANSTPWQNRGYTGHMHNDEVGLIYMNARYYVPSLGRFASADTIVPDPANPQQFNRFSYVLNNPIRLTDPSGHMCQSNNSGLPINDICLTSNSSSPAVTTQAQTQFTSSLINFTGGDWTDAEKRAVHLGALMLAQQLARTMNEIAGGSSAIGWEEAFLSVYGGKVTFHKTGTDGCPNSTCYGEWVGNNTINVYTDIYPDNDENLVSRIPGDLTSDRWAVHELGHGLEAKMNNLLGESYVRNNLPTNVANRNGFAGPFPGWQQSTSPNNNEIFADMVIGWTYGQ